jgi:hypothetical protein
MPVVAIGVAIGVATVVAPASEIGTSTTGVTGISATAGTGGRAVGRVGSGIGAIGRSGTVSSAIGVRVRASATATIGDRRKGSSVEKAVSSGARTGRTGNATANGRSGRGATITTGRGGTTMNAHAGMANGMRVRSARAAATAAVNIGLAATGRGATIPGSSGSP